MPHPIHGSVWSSAAGAATTAFGVALLGVAQISGGPPLVWTTAALLVASLLELLAGLTDERKGGVWMARLFSGAMAFSFAAILVSLFILPPELLRAAPVALVFGIFCLANALFRGLDLLMDRPSVAGPEVIDVTVTFVLAVVLLSQWRFVTPSFLGIVAGIELLTGGLALAATSRLHWPPPELSAYQRGGRPLL
jgi:uncharacterized membrane protein HdeD (DUF308 family)